MLAALETPSEGGVWFRMIDKVYNVKNLWSAWSKSARNKGACGVDGVTIERFEHDVEANLQRLAEQLKDGSYRPKAIRRTYIPKSDGTMRPLGIPTVGDRIVQGALRQVIEPIFERRFARQSYGFRPGRGCKDALRRVNELLRSGYEHVVDADLKGYFDTIPHDPLMERVRERDSGRTDGAQSGRRGATRRGAFSAVEQHLPKPVGPSDGRAGVGDGALRGRLRDPLQNRGTGEAGVGNGAGVGGTSRPEPASGEDANRDRAAGSV
jgi:hypothetical protein